MDDSGVAHISALKKLNEPAHSIYENIHTNINIIYTHTHTHTHTHKKKKNHTHTHNHGLPRFVEMPVEKGKLSAGICSLRKWGDSTAGRQRIPETVGVMKLKEQSPIDLRLLRRNKARAMMNLRHCVEGTKQGL